MKILLFVLLIAFGLKASAQTPAKTTYWLNGQLGSGTYQLNLVGGAGVLLHDKYLVSLKADVNADISSKNSDNTEAIVLGLLVGKKLTHGKYFFLTAAGGPGIVFFDTRGDIVNVSGSNYYGPNKDLVRVGLPLEVKLWANPLPVLGFTLTAGLTVTPRQTFGSISLGVAIGKLRNFRRAGVSQGN